MKIRIEIPQFNDQEITDQMIANPDDWNFYRHAYLIGHELGAVVLVFAENEQDALDEACDKGFMKCFEASDPDHIADFESDDPKLGIEGLGNYSKPHKLDYMWIRELPLPEFSWCALYLASNPTTAKIIE